MTRLRPNQLCKEAEFPQGPSQAVLGEGALGTTWPLPASRFISRQAPEGRGESAGGGGTPAALQRGPGAPVFGTPQPQRCCCCCSGDTGEDSPVGKGRGPSIALSLSSWSSLHALVHPGTVPRGPTGPCPSRASFQGPRSLLPLSPTPPPLVPPFPPRPGCGCSLPPPPAAATAAVIAAAPTAATAVAGHRLPAPQCVFTSDLCSTVGPSLLLVFSTSILQGSAAPLPEDTPNFLPIPRPLSNLF